MRFDLDHLRVFCAVVKAGNFTAAAEILHISQPSVSRTIDLLECRLGFKLFIRTPRGIFITPEGERLNRRAIRLIEEIEMEVKLINDVSSEPQGELKIITTPGLATIWLPEYLTDFLEQCPDMRIEIIGKSKNLEMTDADVLICPSIPHHPNLIQRPFMRFHNKLWASPKYLNKFGKPQKAEDLDKHRLITYEQNNINLYGNTNWILEVGADPDSPRKPFLTINFLEGLINYANKGMGIIEVPEEFVDLKKVDLAPVLPELQGPTIEVCYIYPTKMKDSKRVTALADFLEKKSQI